MKTTAISVVGLGKLGLPLAGCLAKSGYGTIGVDILKDVVEAVNKGISPIHEPGLDELLAEHGGKTLVATTDHGEAVRETSVTFVLTATPSDADGSFSNCQMESALVSLAEALAETESEYHLFVISSTVVPGSIEGSFIPLIERHSRRRLNEGFGVAYDPDFVALGNVVQGFLNPDMVVIGESDPRAGDIVESIHGVMCENEPVISRMALINAELAKVTLNAYITLKITFANTLANLCESIPGADCDEVTAGITPDRRISPLYFSGGPAFGGPCFPRDTRAFCATAARFGEQAELIEAIDRVNEHQQERLADMVLRERASLENKTVGVIGLAFKDKTPSLLASPGVDLVQRLLEQGVSVVAHDPLAGDAAKTLLEGKITLADSVADCLDRCGLSVVTYKSRDFKSAIEGYRGTSPGKIIDCWRMLSREDMSSDLEIIRWGCWNARSA